MASIESEVYSILDPEGEYPITGDTVKIADYVRSKLRELGKDILNRVYYNDCEDFSPRAAQRILSEVDAAVQRLVGKEERE